MGTYDQRKFYRRPNESDGGIDVEEYFDDLSQLLHGFNELGYPQHIPLASARSKLILYPLDRFFHIFHAADLKLAPLLLCKVRLELGESILKAAVDGFHG